MNVAGLKGLGGLLIYPLGGYGGFVYFREPDFKWNTLAVICQHTQVSEMPKASPRHHWVSPTVHWVFLEGPWFPQAAEFFRAGNVGCGNTSTVAVVSLISLVKDHILMWHDWSSMLNDFCDKVLLGKANCVEGKCDHCSVYSTQITF